MASGSVALSTLLSVCYYASFYRFTLALPRRMDPLSLTTNGKYCFNCQSEIFIYDEWIVQSWSGRLLLRAVDFYFCTKSDSENSLAVLSWSLTLFTIFRLACGLATLATFMMWLLCAIIYVSQVYPMLLPLYEIKAEWARQLTTK